MISLIKNLKNKTILSILFLILVTLFFRTYRLDKLYSFDWDQERDASVVSSIIRDKKPVLIGPRVINDSGFFVGPFHYYFLLPFYLLTQGSPYAGAYAALVVELITVVAIYFVSLKIFNSKVAFISALIYSLNPSLVSWNVMYTPLLSIVIFYLCYLLLNKKTRLFPLLIFLFTLSINNHPAMLSLAIPIIVSYVLSSKKLSFKSITLALLFSILPFLPLIIFDLRHEFINTQGIINFVTTPKTINLTNSFLFLRSFWRAINILIVPIGFFQTLVRILIILFCSISFINLKNKNIKILVFTWIFAPLLLLSFYRGDIPEYYYTAALTLTPLLLSLFFVKYISTFYLSFFVIFLIIFQYLNFPKGINGAPSLKNKMAAASYIINQQQDPDFNVSYDLPLGMNSGYAYLFKFLGKEPKNIPSAHLYSIFIITNPAPTGELVYHDEILGIVRR